MSDVHAALPDFFEMAFFTMRIVIGKWRFVGHVIKACADPGISSGGSRSI